MSTTTVQSESTLRVLAKQELANYLSSKLFWVGGALSVVAVVASISTDNDNFMPLNYSLAPAALLGVLGIVTTFGLTRRSDSAAEAAGAVAVPERTRTLALASAAAVPGALALVLWMIVSVTFLSRSRPDWLLPSGVSPAFVIAHGFGAGVVSTIGGPLLGLVLARWLPRRGTSVVAAVVVVIVTILLQGNFKGGQPYRVLWIWTYFIGQLSQGWSSDESAVWHVATAPGNPYLWILYLLTLCALGLTVAVYHDPESGRPQLKKLVVGLVAAAIALGVLTMTVGFSEVLTNPLPCEAC